MVEIPFDVTAGVRALVGVTILPFLKMPTFPDVDDGPTLTVIC
jgi:hypothetical protein